MKKNVMMRLASVLLVCVLLSTSVISGTFAKYVTDGTAIDTARVAKWGVTIEAFSEADNELFKTTYETHNANNDPDYAGPISVESSSTTDVIAPGTSGTFTSFNVTGTPEVATRITYAPDVELTGDWKDVTSAYYCPIKITVGSTTFNGMDYANVDAFEAAVEAAITGATKDYDPNDTLDGVDTDLQISWAWDYETGADQTEKDANNIKDTYLGDWERHGNAAPTISVNVTVTATQID